MERRNYNEIVITNKELQNFMGGIITNKMKEEAAKILKHQGTEKVIDQIARKDAKKAKEITDKLNNKKTLEFAKQDKIALISGTGLNAQVQHAIQKIINQKPELKLSMKTSNDERWFNIDITSSIEPDLKNKENLAKQIKTFNALRTKIKSTIGGFDGLQHTAMNIDSSWVGSSDGRENNFTKFKVSKFKISINIKKVRTNPLEGNGFKKSCKSVVTEEYFNY